MKIAELKYHEERSKPTIYSDIVEHLPTLRKYGEECKHITEMGMRNIVSTWAFITARPEKLVSYDIEDPASMNRLDLAMRGATELDVDFTFKKEDVLKANIEETDLLFIDTLHTATQLAQELDLHQGKVRKYIILHDTKTFGLNGEDDNHRPTLKNEGLTFALTKFLAKNNNWKIKEVFENNNGLTILERVE